MRATNSLNTEWGRRGAWLG